MGFLCELVSVIRVLQGPFRMPDCHSGIIPFFVVFRGRTMGVCRKFVLLGGSSVRLRASVASCGVVVELSSSHCARGAPISDGVERAACALTAASRLRTLHAQQQILHLLGIAVRQQGHKPRPDCGYRGVGGRLRGVRQGLAFGPGPGVSLRAASRSRTSEIVSQAALQVHHDPRLRKWKEGMAVESIHVNWRLCRTPADWIAHTLRMSQTINTTTMMVPTNPKPSISLLLRKKRPH